MVKTNKNSYSRSAQNRSYLVMPAQKVLGEHCAIGAKMTNKALYKAATTKFISRGSW